MAKMGAQVATQANGTKGEYEYYEYDVYNYSYMHAGQPQKVREEVPNNSNGYTQTSLIRTPQILARLSTGHL